MTQGMIANRNFGQCEPLTWMGRVPVYLATALAMAHGVTMILYAFVGAAGGQGWIDSALSFSTSSAVYGLQVWRFVTYAFINPPDLMVAIQLVMLAMFGQEVEKFLGRVSFAWLYALLILAGPVITVALSFFGLGGVLWGSNTPHFAIFIAFVLIYPNAVMFFGILAKWLGIALFGIYSLQFLAGQNWTALGLFWGTCAVAALWLAYEGVGSVSAFAIPSPIAWWKSRQAKKRFRVVPRRDVPASPKPKAEPASSAYESIDPILDKIARQGIGSLTRGEREKLERARAELLEKERSK